MEKNLKSKIWRKILIASTEDKEIMVVIYDMQYSKYFAAWNYLMFPTNLRDRAYYYPHSTGERTDHKTHCNHTTSKQWNKQEPQSG